MRYAFKIAYDGRYFSGSQIQPTVNTVEGQLISVLRDLGYISDKRSAKLQFASRTDAKVSAIANIVAFDTPHPIRLGEINEALNNVFLWAYTEVPPSFNPRHALYREYTYVFPYSVSNLSEINAVLSKMEGTHNFHNFCKHDSAYENYSATLEYARAYAEDKSTIFHFRAPFFLWNQIRKIVGFVTNIVAYPPLESLFDPNISISISPAPAQYLFLSNIVYPNIKFTLDSRAKAYVLNYFSNLTEQYRANSLFFGQMSNSLQFFS